MTSTGHTGRARRAVLAASLLGGLAALPAHGDQPAGSAVFDGATVVLARADLASTWIETATWVGQAADAVMADPRLKCITGGGLDVFSTQQSERLVFTNLTDTAGCATKTFYATVAPHVGQVVPCLTARCVQEQATFRQTQAMQAAKFQADATTATAESADDLATGGVATAKEVSLATIMGGEVLGQYATLAGLSGAYFTATPETLETGGGLIVNGRTVGISTPARMEPGAAVGCLDGSGTCPRIVVHQSRNATSGSASDGPSPHVDPHRFKYFTGLTPYWPKDDSNHGVFGAVIYNIWTLPERVSNEQDFYATSQDASVASEDDSRLTKIWTTWESSSSGIRMVDAAPLGVSQRGAGETTTISATLAGNVSSKKDGSGGDIGGSFGLSRSYTRPVDNHGGGAINATGHYALWETADNGSGAGKEAAGVETWAIPAGSEIGFIWHAKAWYCNNPCGP